MSDDDASRPGDSMPPVPRNRGVKCKGRTVIRHDRNHADPELRGQPILDDDGARQYRPCEAYAANGTEHCQAHGGSAPQTIHAAKRTLALGADDFAIALRQIATDERVPPETRIKAINSAMDRIGIRAGVDVGLEAPRWQGVLGKLFGVEDEESSTQDAPAEPSTQERDDDAADPTGIIRDRVRKLNTRTDVAPTPPARETKPKRAPRRATPPSGERKFEGFGE